MKVFGVFSFLCLFVFTSAYGVEQWRIEKFSAETRLVATDLQTSGWTTPHIEDVVALEERIARAEGDYTAWSLEDYRSNTQNHASLRSGEIAYARGAVAILENPSKPHHTRDRLVAITLSDTWEAYKAQNIMVLVDPNASSYEQYEALKLLVDESIGFDFSRKGARIFISGRNTFAEAFFLKLLGKLGYQTVTAHDAHDYAKKSKKSFVFHPRLRGRTVISYQDWKKPETLEDKYPLFSELTEYQTRVRELLIASCVSLEHALTGKN